jgi:hypothetical protein
MTTIGFILGQVAEGRYKWDEDISLEYTSGFMTGKDSCLAIFKTWTLNVVFLSGVYGMWNIYIMGLLFLYAPSHKNWSSDSNPGDRGKGFIILQSRRVSKISVSISTLT